MIKPAKNSPKTPKINKEPIGDKVTKTEIYKNMEIATSSNKPNKRVMTNKIKVVTFGGKVMLYGFGKKKATIKIG